MSTPAKRSDKAEKALHASTDALSSGKCLKALVVGEKTGKTPLSQVEKQMVAFVLHLQHASEVLGDFRKIVAAVDTTPANAEERSERDDLLRVLKHVEATVAHARQESAEDALDASPRVRAVMEEYRSEAFRHHEFNTFFKCGLEAFRRADTIKEKWFVYEILRRNLKKHAEWWGTTKYLVQVDVYGILPHKRRLLEIAIKLPLRVCTKKRKARVEIDLTKVKKACK